MDIEPRSQVIALQQLAQELHLTVSKWFKASFSRAIDALGALRPHKFEQNHKNKRSEWESLKNDVTVLCYHCLRNPKWMKYVALPF